MPQPQLLAAERVRLWPDSAVNYRGLIADSNSLASEGTILLFHGNGGTALDRSFYLAPLMNLGFRVILAEYPQYGGRPGELGEKPFVADGLETVCLAYEQYGKPLYLLGESLGCGVAAAVCRQSPVPIAGIILITPWDTLALVAQSLFPFLPVKILLADKYDNIANLQTFRGRISVIGAEQDEILPVAHARNLYEKLPHGQKRLWIIKGAGHNDWPFFASFSLFQEITDFVNISRV